MVTAIRHNVRKNISEFTAKKRLRPSVSIISIIFGTVGWYFLQTIIIPTISPSHWADNVPHATPSTFIPKTNTRKRLTAIFEMFIRNETIIGALAFFIPRNHPVNTKVDNEAGAPHTSILKYVSAILPTEP